MARGACKLTARTVAAIREPGRYGDGGGLWLQVSRSGSKSWLFRYMHHGRARAMGLGAVDTVPLSEARAAALAARKLLASGVDPVEARKAERRQARLAAAKALTFKDAAEACIDARKTGWRNAKHALQWRNSLATYAYPVLGAVPVQDIDVGLVMKVLEPLWSAKTETASRVRGRIEAVLDWATARGYREGENPARWRGHLQNLLPARTRVRKVTHHPALPYTEIADFMRALRQQEGVAARALEFLILTATRTSETIGARWSEIDLENKVWTIPATRIKAGKEHRVPLSAQAGAVLEKMRALGAGATPRVPPGQCGDVFPGGRPGKPLSSMALLALLARMGRGDVTAHGFRSTFRDWAAERTAFPREVAEMALAHAVGDKVEAAYRRGDLFEKRRRLMEAWAKFCDAPAAAGAVVALQSHRPDDAA